MNIRQFFIEGKFIFVCGILYKFIFRWREQMQKQIYGCVWKRVIVFICGLCVCVYVNICILGFFMFCFFWKGLNQYSGFINSFVFFQVKCVCLWGSGGGWGEREIEIWFFQVSRRYLNFVGRLVVCNRDELRIVIIQSR